jgi:hypothetical protein
MALKNCVSQFALMLRGECRQVSVRGQVGGSAQFIEETEKTVAKEFAWFQHHNARRAPPRAPSGRHA